MSLLNLKNDDEFPWPTSGPSEFIKENSKEFTKEMCSRMERWIAFAPSFDGKDNSESKNKVQEAVKEFPYDLGELADLSKITGVFAREELSLGDIMHYIESLKRAIPSTILAHIDVTTADLFRTLVKFIEQKLIIKNNQKISERTHYLPPRLFGYVEEPLALDPLPVNGSQSKVLEFRDLNSTHLHNSAYCALLTVAKGSGGSNFDDVKLHYHSGKEIIYVVEGCMKISYLNLLDHEEFLKEGNVQSEYLEANDSVRLNSSYVPHMVTPKHENSDLIAFIAYTRPTALMKRQNEINSKLHDKKIEIGDKPSNWVRNARSLDNDEIAKMKKPDFYSHVLSQAFSKERTQSGFSYDELASLFEFMRITQLNSKVIRSKNELKSTALKLRRIEQGVTDGTLDELWELMSYYDLNWQSIFGEELVSIKCHKYFPEGIDDIYHDVTEFRLHHQKSLQALNRDRKEVELLEISNSHNSNFSMHKIKFPRTDIEIPVEELFLSSHTSTEGIYVLKGQCKLYWYPRQPELFKRVYGYIPPVDERCISDLETRHKKILGAISPFDILDSASQYISKKAQEFIEDNAVTLDEGSYIQFDASRVYHNVRRVDHNQESEALITNWPF
jgi:hypothetical protein